MKNHDDEKLTRLLKESGPETIPTLEPDPHLPTRIRALARESSERRIAGAHRRWVPLSLAAGAVAVAIAIGGYIGYSAGASMAAATVEVAQNDDATSGADAFWNAWSQAGFAEDLADVETTGGDGEQ
jgi:hypothetical protein